MGMFRGEVLSNMLLNKVIYVHICIYIYTYERTYIYIYIHIYIYIYNVTSERVYVYMYANVYVLSMFGGGITEQHASQQGNICA
jgi:hypothetical protein